MPSKEKGMNSEVTTVIISSNLRSSGENIDDNRMAMIYKQGICCECDKAPRKWYQSILKNKLDEIGNNDYYQRNKFVTVQPVFSLHP